MVRLTRVMAHSIELIESHIARNFQTNPSKTESTPFKNKNKFPNFRPNFFWHFGTFHFPCNKSAQNSRIITSNSSPQSQYGFTCAQKNFRALTQKRGSHDTRKVEKWAIFDDFFDKILDIFCTFSRKNRSPLHFLYLREKLEELANWLHKMGSRCRRKMC